MRIYRIIKKRLSNSFKKYFFYKVPKSLIRFTLVGITGFLVQIFVYYLLSFTFVKNSNISIILSILVTTLWNYNANNLYTFNDKRLYGRKFIEGMFFYLLSAILPILINILVTISLFWLTKNILIAKLFGIFFACIINYLSIRRFVWK